MDKSLVGISCGLFSVAILLAVYGAGFSWRQILVGGVAALIAFLAVRCWRDASPKQEFSRIQFKIDLPRIGLALLDAGVYNKDDLSGAVRCVFESIPGGQITFTWLEPNLFYMNVTNLFSERPELLAPLKPFGGRAVALEYRSFDAIEFRTTSEAYDLVLVTSEQAYIPRSYRDPGADLILFSLPRRFITALQGQQPPGTRQELAKQILGTTDLKYWENPEVLGAWGYKGKYGDFRWWYL